MLKKDGDNVALPQVRFPPNLVIRDDQANVSKSANRPFNQSEG